MNFYFLVEGRRTEKKVYREWTKHVFQGMGAVDRVEDFSGNNFFVLSANGYPLSSDTYQKTVQDVHDSGVDHLFVCVDADEESLSERYEKISDELKKLQCPCSFSVIVADCCMETWFLGNQKMMSRQPAKGSKFFQMYQHYNVLTQDPEGMPKPSVFVESRAEYHVNYFQAMCQEKGVTYTKKYPGSVLESTYLAALVKRCQETNHLSSFQALMTAWQSLGGKFPV
ncbi:MAG: hypothetical protein H7832_00170 [Magnetococcus sp. DMHC-6]